MMSYDDDDLDRLLFALPLEEPPADLRASILTATAYRAAPVFKPWEVSIIGGVAADRRVAGRAHRARRPDTLRAHTRSDYHDHRSRVHEWRIHGVACRRVRDRRVAHTFHGIPTSAKGRRAGEPLM